MFDGKGIHYFKGGDYYDGLWRNNLKHGQGKYVSGQLVEAQEWREGQKWSWKTSNLPPSDEHPLIVKNKTEKQMREKGWVK